MITDLDIYRSAAVLIPEHGDDAPIDAAQMIDDMLDRGDLEGPPLAVLVRPTSAVDIHHQNVRTDSDGRRTNTRAIVGMLDAQERWCETPD